MTDQEPDAIKHVTPRRASASLRGRVLDAVADELARPSRRGPPRWERWFELSAAACLVVGAVMAFWQLQANERWHARVYGNHEGDLDSAVMAAGLEPTIDQQAARQLVAHWPKRRSSRGATELSSARYRRAIRELVDGTAWGTL
jgi:hypothetical protein